MHVKGGALHRSVGAADGVIISNLVPTTLTRRAVAQPPAAAPAPAAFGAAGASSGFLHGAAATALGVVGGQLLFQGIQSMFGQHAGSILSGQSMQPPLSETVVNNFYGDQPSS